MSRSPEADRYALIRRLSFDLTGLPPAPEEIEAFVADTRADAYQRLVERYLASPHYGERWGKWWLDAAGYADSNGYFNADTDRPLAYRYRDYVVRSFNADKPFDQFLREQLAGDELAGFRPGGEIHPGQVDLLVATHFLRNPQDGTGESDGNPDEVRADRYSVLEGTEQMIGSALLGLTLQCARCHDHKFEPVTQAEYYSLQAILGAAFDPEHWVKPNDRQVNTATAAEVAAWEARTRQIEEAIADRRQALASWVPDSSPAAAQFQEAYKQKRQEVEAAVAELNRQRTDKPGRTAVVVDVSPTPPDWFLLVRGNYAERGPKVEPGVPAALAEPSNGYVIGPPAGASSGRRLALARWLTQPGSMAASLLARVTVNRAWQQHFGTGICSTPDNLGFSGSPPTHPELLDDLARKLIESGWSIKQLQRAIVLSAAYRQASLPRDDGLRVDPDDRLLWRFPLRRLDAESLRDAALAIAGELDTTMGGRYVPTHRNAEGEVIADEGQPGGKRRSLYVQQRRTQTLSWLEVFDAPSIVVNCTRRNQATIPLQSLSALNSEFSIRRAKGLARRLSGQPDGDVIGLAFLLVAGRPPRDDERSAAERFLASQPAAYAGQAEAANRALVDFCQMLFASNAFLYME
ncbi:MAG TPA: DUF1549 and DUF1553 domain-containing protein [Pirellulales bacterium]|nr:DUF1549 and DUF1553 domain-containing protein [Pirellulales bacterium]